MFKHLSGLIEYNFWTELPLSMEIRFQNKENDCNILPYIESFRKVFKKDIFYAW